MSISSKTVLNFTMTASFIWLIAVIFFSFYKTIEIVDYTGKVQEIYVNRMNIEKTEKILKSRILVENRALQTGNCHYIGFCYSCIGGCGYGFHSFCSGHRDETVNRYEVIFSYRYEIKDRGILFSPEFKKLEIETLETGTCR